MNNIIINILGESISIKEKMLVDETFLDKIDEAAKKIADTFISGGKVFFCGNGGSAAIAQHIAAEMVGRFQKERKGLPVIALTTDTSVLTAIANDYGFEKIFERQIEALCSDKDIVVGITTSGDSLNVKMALLAAKQTGAFTIGLLGKDGGICKDFCNIALLVKENDTARIQEIHILIGHIICRLIENYLYE